MAFVAGVIAVVRDLPVAADWVTGDTPLLHALPDAADWLGSWIGFWGLLVIAGALTRTASAMFAAGVMAWAIVYTTRFGTHTISAMLVALLCLFWSRWGDAWSVDAWLRRVRGVAPRRGSPSDYGFTLWVPGLVLGVTFAAAAFAKVREGADWILNGTVKYHFLTDSRDALVDWGPGIGSYPALAVLLSFAAVAIEALVIVGALSRTYRYRAASGVAAGAILAAFALFQGLIWPGWWLLLLSFLPWHLVRGGDATAPGASRRGYAQAMAAVVVVLQQVVVTALKLEIAPMLSAYDMYSTTYDSPEQYEEKSHAYRLIARFNDDTTEECAISEDEAEGMRERADEDAGAALERCVETHRQRVGTTGRLRGVEIMRRRMAVDWKQWRLLGEVTEPMPGPSIDRGNSTP